MVAALTNANKGNFSMTDCNFQTLMCQGESANNEGPELCAKSKVDLGAFTKSAALNPQHCKWIYDIMPDS